VSRTSHVTDVTMSRTLHHMLETGVFANFIICLYVYIVLISSLNILEMGRTTSTERTRKWRENKKKDILKWEEHQKKDRERKQIDRQKLKKKLSKEKKRENREKHTERVRIWREKKRLQNTKDSSQEISPIGSYSSRKTFGKALLKARRSLPVSPNKKKLLYVN